VHLFAGDSPPNMQIYENFKIISILNFIENLYPVPICISSEFQRDYIILSITIFDKVCRRKVISITPYLINTFKFRQHFAGPYSKPQDLAKKY
jgi:hypothetical protein